MNGLNHLILTKIQVFESKYVPTFHMVTPRDFYSLSYRINGEVSLKTPTFFNVSTPDTLTFVPKGRGYETEICTPGDMVVIHFDAMGESGGDPKIIFPANPYKFRNKFLQIYQDYLAFPPPSYRALAGIYGLLADLAEEKGQTPHPILAPALTVIHQRFTDPLTIPDLASFCGVSDVYFRKLFSKSFGLSPLAYIKKLRIEKATSLLASGLYTVSQAAYACGFESESYFSKECKRLTGLTPSQWKG